MHFETDNTFMKAGCLTKNLLEMSEEGSCVHSHGVVKCIELWYSTTIRGCGVVDTLYQVVNSTYGYK